MLPPTHTLSPLTLSLSLKPCDTLSASDQPFCLTLFCPLLPLFRPSQSPRRSVESASTVRRVAGSYARFCCRALAAGPGRAGPGNNLRHVRLTRAETDESRDSRDSGGGGGGGGGVGGVAAGGECGAGIPRPAHARRRAGGPRLLQQGDMSARRTLRRLMSGKVALMRSRSSALAVFDSAFGGISRAIR
jgi:hypothetical protein